MCVDCQGDLSFKAIQMGRFVLTLVSVLVQPDDAIALNKVAKPQGTVTLLIGPEGGFSPEEVLIAKQAGFIPILLGPRVLRTETAALAGITALQLLWGDMNSTDALPSGQT